MLVAAVDLTPKENSYVEMVLRDFHQRNLFLTLAPDLLSNLLTLMERALGQSEWGLVATGAPNHPTPTEPTPTPRILN